MNIHVNQLIRLSQLDKEIDAFLPRIEKIQKRLKVLEEKRDVVLQNISVLSEEISDLKSKNSKNEQHLMELSDKIKTIAKKTSLVKTDKEAKALQAEEEIAKDQCNFINEEIARIEKIVDLKQDLISKANVELLEEEEHYKSVEAEVTKETEAVEKERLAIYKEKENLVSQMSNKVLSFYEKIRKWAGNSAVVPVKKQSCYGCFMRINNKTYADVTVSEDIVTCPHCGRILYKDQEVQ